MQLLYILVVLNADLKKFEVLRVLWVNDKARTKIVKGELSCDTEKFHIWSDCGILKVYLFDELVEDFISFD